MQLNKKKFKIYTVVVANPTLQQYYLVIELYVDNQYIHYRI